MPRRSPSPCASTARPGDAALPLRGRRGRGPPREAAPDRRQPGAADGQGGLLLGGGGGAHRGLGGQAPRSGDLGRRVLRERRQRQHRGRAGGPRPGRGAARPGPGARPRGRWRVVSVVRVHLADDHTMFREGLEAILSSREGIKVVGTSSTGPEAADRVRQTKPDVVVTQLDMQPKTAQEIIGGLREASPGSRIVVLTLWDNLRYVQAISRMGIDAYLHKSSSAEELVATVDAVTLDPGGGNAVISMPRGMLERLGEGPVGALSQRETEVVLLAARGLSNRLIGQELHVSEATVKRHLANIYQKIGVRSRNEAVRKALVEQWIGLHEITSASSADGDGSSGGSDGSRG